MFQRILVPLDGSVLAEQALAHALFVASIFDAQLILLHVLDSSMFFDNTNITEPFNWQVRKAQSEVYLQSVAARLGESGKHVTHALLEGKAAESIVDYAHSENIDLLVLTTHGASGLSRWNASSVVQKVIEKIYLPVLLVRSYPPAAHQEEKGTGETTGQDEAVEYRRILLPIDTSRRAECALAAAVSLATENTTLVMAAVIRPPEIPVPPPYPPEANELIERFMGVSRESINTYLEEQQRRLPAKVETRVIEHDNVSVALHELAEQEDVDLVVLCAHGQTGGMNWPYGSVSRNYIEHGDRTVLIIQDVPGNQVLPSAVEIAARKYGRR